MSNEMNPYACRRCGRCGDEVMIQHRTTYKPDEWANGLCSDCQGIVLIQGYAALIVILVIIFLILSPIIRMIG